MSIDQNHLRNIAHFSSTNKSKTSTESKSKELRKKGDLKEPKAKKPLCAQSKEKVAITSLKRKSSGCPSASICEEKKFRCQNLGKKTDNSYSSRKGKNDVIHCHVAKANKRLSENVNLNTIVSEWGKEIAESNICLDSDNHQNRKKLTAKRKYSPANNHENAYRNISKSNLVSNKLSVNNSNSLSKPDSKQRYKIPKIQSQAVSSAQPNRTYEENVQKDVDKKKRLCTGAKYESKNTTMLSTANCFIPSSSKINSQAVSSKSCKESAFENKSIQETKSVQLKISRTIPKPMCSSKAQSIAMTGHELSFSPFSYAHDNSDAPSRDTRFVSTPRKITDYTSPSCCNDTNTDYTSPSCCIDTNWSNKNNFMGCTRESEASMALSKDSVFSADKQYQSTHFSNQADNQCTFDIMNMNSNQNSNTDSVDDNEMESMDVDEEIILTNLQEVRNQTSHIFNQSSGSCLDIATTDVQNKEAVINENVIKKPKSATVIVDTNVLITNLGIIKELLKTDIPDFGKPYILLPWVVMQELDYLKRRKMPAQNSNNATSYKAADAIRFIHTQLTAQNSQLYGQTAYQANEPSDIQIECNDDRILHCCIQTKKKEGENLVILLTRDINLINKAVIMSITAADIQTIRSKLSLSQDSDVKKQPQVTSLGVNGNSVTSKAGNQLAPSTVSNKRNVQSECHKHNQQLTLSAAKTNSHLQQKSFVQSPAQPVVDRQNQYLRPTDTKVFQNNELSAAGRHSLKDSLTQNQRSGLTAKGIPHCESFVQKLNQTSTAAKTVTQSQLIIPTQTITVSYSLQPRPSTGKHFPPDSSLQNQTPTVIFNHSQHQRYTAAETFNHNQHQRSTAAEIFNHNQHQRSTAAKIFNHNQHQRPTAAENFPQNTHQRQRLINNVLSDSATQIQIPVLTGNESQHRNTNTHLQISTEPPKQNVISVPCVDDADTLVLAKFESVWKVIFDVLQQVSSILSQGHSHADYQAAIDMCPRIGTILSQLKEHFNSCLSLSPVILGNHILEFEKFSSSLNSFYRDAQLACTDPIPAVSYNQLINHFKQGKNRSLLSTGYEQLVTFIEDYQNLLLNYATR